MKKILMMLIVALSVGAMAFAGEYNPFHEMYKVQAKKELQKGVVQFNYLLVDEKGEAIPNATLRYVNHDNKILSEKADANGKVHMQFSQPNFVQLCNVVIGGVEYRVIGDDISEDVDLKDIAKGEVEYFVVQKHTANKTFYVYEAD